MVQFSHSDAISVLIEHLPEDEVTVAQFEWSNAPPEDTYTIPVGLNISIEFDGHFPVRPKSIQRYDNHETDEAESALGELFGEEMVVSMDDARKAGNIVLTLVLSPENRAKLAELQLSSPSTPHKLRKVCSDLAGPTVLLAQHDKTNEAA